MSSAVFRLSRLLEVSRWSVSCAILGCSRSRHLTGAVDSRQQQCDQWEAFARFLLLTVLCPLRVEAGLGLARIQERLDEHSVSNLDSDPYSEDYRQVTWDRHTSGSSTD